jgi:hypothetical protein
MVPVVRGGYCPFFLGSHCPLTPFIILMKRKKCIRGTVGMVKEYLDSNPVPAYVHHGIGAGSPVADSALTVEKATSHEGQRGKGIRAMIFVAFLFGGKEKRGPCIFPKECFPRRF